MWNICVDNYCKFITNMHGHSFGGANASCQESITRSAFNRWVSLDVIINPSLYIHHTKIILNK